MTKFELINGQLCRMVEPEPLLLDSKMPCVVRYERVYLDCLFTWVSAKMNLRDKIMICKRIKNGCADTSHTNIFPYSAHEIIGYPVADGSAEWALYQMMQGKKVASSNGIVYLQDKDDNDLIKYTDGYGQIWIQTPYMFLRCVGASGWKLYEPEPEPETAPFANVKRGEFVEVINFNRAGDPIQDRVLFNDDDGVITLEKTGGYWRNGEGIDPSMYRITRIIPRSEVRIKVTLEGTISKISGNTLAFELEDNNGVVTVIGYQQLDPATRSLVESLLKAQEEK